MPEAMEAVRAGSSFAARCAAPQAEANGRWPADAKSTGRPAVIGFG